MEVLKKFIFNLNCDKPELFVSSQWQHDKKTPNLKYLIYRCILASYYISVVIISICTAIDCHQLKFYLIYLTNWNVLLNGFQSALGVFLTLHFYRKSINFSNDRNKMPTSFKVFWIVCSTSIVLSTSLSCVYWTLIYNGRDKGINDALTHAGNSIILLIDLFVHAHPPRFSHVIYPFLFGLTYIIFSIIYTVSGGTDRDYNHFIYTIIDWLSKTTDACMVAIAILVFSSLMHILLTVLIKIRIFLHQRIIGQQNTDENITCSDNLAFEA